MLVSQMCLGPGKPSSFFAPSIVKVLLSVLSVLTSGRMAGGPCWLYRAKIVSVQGDVAMAAGWSSPFEVT